jgi:hypothetical protein
MHQASTGVAARGSVNLKKDRVHWIHPDAHSAYAIRLETSTALHAGGWNENKENCENHNSDA